MDTNEAQGGSVREQAVATMRTSFPIFLSKRAFHPLFSAVAAHGATDVDSDWCIPSYVLFCATPLPPPFVTAVFNLASVVHFAADVGVVGSFALHALVALVGVVWGSQHASRLMMAYLAFAHVPLHYARCLATGRHSAIVAAALFTAVVAIGTRGMDTICLSQATQRVVVAHVFVEKMIRTA